MLKLRVNGREREVAVSGDASLLLVLRNDLGLAGPKFGCGLDQCGACAVLVNGIPVRSCVTRAGEVEGKAIVTLEGLGTPEKPDPLQKAFITEQAMQCGYCANGMIIAAKALLAANPNPTDAQVRSALDGHLCRCGAHNRIVRAVLRAAKEARS